MTQKDNILQELKELNSNLAGLSQNVYSVPDGYFDGLIAQVLRRIKAMEAADAGEELGHLSPLLKGMSKQMSYSVPAGYFENLAENAMAAAKNNDQQSSLRATQSEAKEELESISPLLSGLKKENPYTVPQGYFESLTRTIVAEETKPAAKVISLTHRKWFRYAAAAVITGLLVMTGFLIFNKNETGGRALAKFSRDVKKMNDVQKDDMIDFIDAGMSGDETAQVSPQAKSDEVKNLLQGISEEELKDFQEQTEDVQDVLMTN